MLIIVEGPDCSGKSTLVRHIVDRLEADHPGDPVKVFHKSPPRSHPLTEYVEPLLGYRPDQGIHVVADRWHWGEMVYPELMHRPTAMDVGVWRYTEMFLRSRGALVVYPMVSTTELTARHARRGDDLVDLPTLLKVDQAFRALSMRSTLGVLRFRPDLDPTRQVRTVLEEATARAKHTALLNDLETYVGPPRPEALLVGDERPARMSRDHPALMPFAPRSGHFLLNALRGPALESLGIVNANDVDDVVSTWLTLGCPKKVVALGRLASRRLDRAKIRHSRVPHPQFIRRFYQRHRDEYGLAIAEALDRRDLDLSGWRPANPSWRPR